MSTVRATGGAPDRPRAGADPGAEARGDADPAAGHGEGRTADGPAQPIRLFAILNPPPPPASPGAYDFGRNAYFQGWAASAFALGETRPAWLARPPWRLRLAMAVNGARFALAQRIVDAAGRTDRRAWRRP